MKIRKNFFLKNIVLLLFIIIDAEAYSSQINLSFFSADSSYNTSSELCLSQETDYGDEDQVYQSFTCDLIQLPAGQSPYSSCITSVSGFVVSVWQPPKVF
jgi:hypothetical protein